MRILIACEYSGVIRNAFLARGHDAWSCDLLATEQDPKTRHYQRDVKEILGYSWDLVIAHPPCKYLTNAGSKHLYVGMKKSGGIDPVRWENMLSAVEFFVLFLGIKVNRVAVENPIMHCHASSRILQTYSQLIQPWMFGHAETKATCLWLHNLPKLVPTNIIAPDYERWPSGKGNGYNPKVHYASPSPKNDPDKRMRERSRTITGYAEAMADQWGNL